MDIIFLSTKAANAENMEKAVGFEHLLTFVSDKQKNAPSVETERYYKELKTNDYSAFSSAASVIGASAATAGAAAFDFLERRVRVAFLATVFAMFSS